MPLGRNNFSRSIAPVLAQVMGLVTGSATAPTVTIQTGDLEGDQQAVSISRSSTGVYVVSITNFRGKTLSSTGVNVQATPTTISNMVSATSATWTAATNTLVVTFRVVDDTATAQDNGFYFQISAF